MTMNCAMCGELIGRDIVTVSHEHFRNCGDHDDRVPVRVWAFCSYRCVDDFSFHFEGGGDTP